MAGRGISADVLFFLKPYYKNLVHTNLTKIRIYHTKLLAWQELCALQIDYLIRSHEVCPGLFVFFVPEKGYLTYRVSSLKPLYQKWQEEIKDIATI